MGGEDNLHIRIEIENHVDEVLLPIDMKAHLWFVHKEYIVLIVLNEHGEQDGKHLLLTTRQLIGHEHLTNLSEGNLVLGAYESLARLGKESVEHVLKLLLRFGNLLCLGGCIGVSTLQHIDDTVADVHLIVEILALKLVELPVEFGDYRGIHNFVYRLTTDKRTVHTADKVVANPTCILGHHLKTYALERVARKLPSLHQSPYHLI